MPYADCPSGVQKVICFSPCVPILDVAQVGNSQVVQERKEIDHQSVLGCVDSGTLLSQQLMGSYVEGGKCCGWEGDNHEE